MSSVNKVFLLGRLGNDPEVRYTSSGSAVCNFSMATSEKWKDKNSGELQEKTTWHRIVTFNRLAEVCGEYLAKGKQIHIEGKLQTRDYEKDGETRYITEVVASSMVMLGNSGEGGGSRRAEQQQEAYRGPAPEDDDIPF